MSTTTPTRHPTISFPTLHLDSFTTLSPRTFPPSPPSSDDHTAGIPRPSQDASREPRRSIASSGRVSPFTLRTARTDDRASNGWEERKLSYPTSPLRINRPLGSLSKSTTYPPPLPAPTLSLPPLPSISPITPIQPLSPCTRDMSLADLPRIPPSLAIPQHSKSPVPRHAISSSEKGKKPLGPSLTVHIPSTSPTDFASVIQPTLRDSASLPRRRTVIQAGSTPSRASPVIMGSITPPEPSSPTRKSKVMGGDGGQMPVLMMPVARTAGVAAERLEKKASLPDIKAVTTSPTGKRPLPRRPVGEQSSSRSSIPNRRESGSTLTPQPPTLSYQSSQQTPSARNISISQPTPYTSASWPLPRPPTVHLPISDATPRANSLSRPILAQKHQPTGSTSSIPIIAGLADAGPYPSTSPAPMNRSNPTPINIGVGLGRPSNLPQMQAGPSRRPGPQEEVCLECMMRDRDLADVVVSGEGIWERGSDGDWDELKDREAELLRSINRGAGSMGSEGLPSLDHSVDSEDDSPSVPSTGHSLETEEMRRRSAVRKARRREVDYRVAKEVGWRCFKWEQLEGLPRGFRGCRGGPLSEDGIRNVMAKFPSASKHRFEYLENFLDDQWISVLQIRAEAKRLGRYPGPDEAYGLPGVIAGPRTSSVAWEAKHARELSEHMRGVFGTPPGPPPVSLVRPSPSSPADLAGLARQTVLPPSRPLTQLYNHKEPSRSPASRYAMNPEYGDDAEDLWTAAGAGEAGLRPFSFAVRAGAVSSMRGSSDWHGGGRKSFFGKFGGSVTSLFGGSHGGSGSMMDMHLGLDADRQNRTSSNMVHAHPRAVSLASPTRPSFFSRSSRASSVNGDAACAREPRGDRVIKSISSSRLSQMLPREPSPEPREDAGEERRTSKKKSFGKLLKMMRPKSSHGGKATNRDEDKPHSRRAVDENELAPPPPIPYLVNRGDRRRSRERNGSEISTLVDSQPSIALKSRQSTSNMPYGFRSVSAPVNDSSSVGSSASPTSSRYRRESYASGREYERRGSGMEMLGISEELPRGSQPPSGTGTWPPVSSSAQHPNWLPANTATWPPVGTNPSVHPIPGARLHNKTASSLSNSSLAMPIIETPPPGINGALSFFPLAPSQHPLNDEAQYPQPTQLSPNRYKNLPPLPPPDERSRSRADLPYSASPDSFAAAFPDQPDYTRSPYTSQQNSPRGYHQPRASYEPPSQRFSNGYAIGRERERQGEKASPRLAHSMYVGSGRGMEEMGGIGLGRGEDAKSVKSRKGLKGLFGRSGRVA